MSIPENETTTSLLTEIRDAVNRIATPTETLETVLGRQADATIRAAEIHSASWDRLTDAIRDQSGALRENAASWRDGASAMRDVAGAMRDLGLGRRNGNGTEGGGAD